MIRRSLLSLAALSVLASSVDAQAPVVTKVDPPNWWAGHSINRAKGRYYHAAATSPACDRNSRS